MSCNNINHIPNPQMPLAAIVHEAMGILRGRNFTLVTGLAMICVTSLLLGHQIAQKTREPGFKGLVANFAQRRARLLDFCQKNKNTSDLPSAPLFLSYFKNLPGDILRIYDNIFIEQKS